jgi:hypothetical protein
MPATDLYFIAFSGKVSAQQKPTKKGKQYFEPFYADALKVPALYNSAIISIIDMLSLIDRWSLWETSGRLPYLCRRYWCDC